MKLPSLLLILLMLGFLLLGIFGMLRLREVIASWYWLESIGVWPGPVYLAASGTAWVLAGFLPLIALLFQHRWSVWITRSGAILASTWYWVDRLLVSRSTSSLVNIPFAAVLTLLLLLLTFGILQLKSTRRSLNLE